MITDERLQEISKAVERPDSGPGTVLLWTELSAIVSELIRLRALTKMTREVDERCRQLEDECNCGCVTCMTCDPMREFR